jgi:hypothetical protein
MTQKPVSWSAEGSGIPPGGPPGAPPPGSPPGGQPPGPPGGPPPGPGGAPPPPPYQGAPPPPIRPDRDGPAWERDKSLGGLFSTLWSVLFDAPQTFRRMIRDAGLGGPILFFLILATLCGWIGMMWEALFSAAMPDMGGAFGGGSPEMQQYMEAFQTPLFRLAQGLFLPAILLIYYFVLSAIIHLFMMVVGGANQPFETTARVLAYACGATAIFQILPICGGIIGFIWSLVVAIIGLAEAHETSMGRSAAAVLLPVFLCCLCIVLAAVLGGLGIAQLAGGL